MSQTPEFVPSSFEQTAKQKHERFADQIRKDLNDALALLDKAKAEMTGDDLKNAWQTMEQVERLSNGAHIVAERLRISLRLESEQTKS